MTTIGRPTKFSPHYCDEVVECMGRGYSLTAFAGEIGVARSTINEWMAQFPEFSEAVKKGKAKRVRHLEERLMGGDTGPRVTSMIFALKNADPEEWRDKVQQEVTGANGGPQEHVHRVERVIVRPPDPDR